MFWFYLLLYKPNNVIKNIIQMSLSAETLFTFSIIGLQWHHYFIFFTCDQIFIRLQKKANSKTTTLRNVYTIIYIIINLIYIF